MMPSKKKAIILSSEQKILLAEAKVLSNKWLNKLNLIDSNNKKHNQEMSFHLMEIFQSAHEIEILLKRVSKAKSKKAILDLLVSFEVESFEHYNYHCKKLKKLLINYLNKNIV